jgi:ADP-ribosylarginine hydrolase
MEIKSLKEKVEASIMLASYLDTIGFKNGEFEFKGNIKITSLNDAASISYFIVYHYFILGGSKHMSLKNLVASDDTLLLLATTYAILNDGGEQNYIKEYLRWFPIISENKRGIGIQTNKGLSYLKKNIDKKKNTYLLDLKFDKEMGGNGAAIRTATIGIKWHNDIDKIIEESIVASRVTHNYYIGFLGGLVSAIFTSFAFNNISPWLWLDKLLEIYESNKIFNYIHTTNFKNTIDNDIKDFFYFLYKYKEERLNNIIKFRRTDDILYPDNVLRMMLEYNQSLKKDISRGENSLISIGISGLDAVIFAYDCLLLSIVPEPNYSVNLNNPTYSWESLVFFGCLHIGDTDSTGVIIGAWYGALNGFEGFNKEKLIELEFYKELKEVSEKLYSQI